MTTLYNLHIYIEKSEIIHVVTYKRKYMTSWTPVISCCRNLKWWKAAYIANESQTFGSDCSGSGIICSNCCLRTLGRLKESAKYSLWRQFATLSNAYYWVAYLYWQKCHYHELEHCKREENHSTDTWVVANGWLFAGDKHYPIQIIFPTTRNLSTATEDIRSPIQLVQESVLEEK